MLPRASRQNDSLFTRIGGAVLVAVVESLVRALHENLSPLERQAAANPAKAQRMTF